MCALLSSNDIRLGHFKPMVDVSVFCLTMISVLSRHKPHYMHLDHIVNFWIKMENP